MRHLEILRQLLVHALKADPTLLNYEWNVNFSRIDKLNAELIITGKGFPGEVMLKQQLMYSLIEHHKYELSAPERITDEYMEMELHFKMLSQLIQQGICEVINAQKK